MSTVYVAAPYADAEQVRALHRRMRVMGLQPTSSWAEAADGPESFTNKLPEVLRDFALANDAELLRSSAVLVLARDGVGGEMFAEARLALDNDIPVFWVGRRTLSAWREGVVLCEDVDDGLSKILHARKGCDK